MVCGLAGVCSGCRDIGVPYAAQLVNKADALKARWAAAGLPPTDVAVQPVGGGLRDRVDLTLYRQDGALSLGLWDLTHTRILHPETCPQLSPALSLVHERFRQDLPDVEFMHLRLRVAPDGAAGIWLDPPRATAEHLLSEGSWLRRQLGWAWVEVGQRRLPVVDDGGLRLAGAPEIRPWSRTWLGAAESPADLWLSIGDFSQVGLVANRALVRAVRELAASCGARRWLELGAGSGNLTLPLAAQGAEVVAVEVSPRAAQGLARAAEIAGLSSRVSVQRRSFHATDPALLVLLADADALLVDPPRSGLGASLDALALLPEAQRPRALVYVSCFAQSLIADAARLASLGYGCAQLGGLDLYPHSPHCEWVGLFTRG